MQIKFGETVIHLPADSVQIILHKNDMLSWAKTNHDEYIGLEIIKGDHNAPIKEFGEPPILGALSQALFFRNMRSVLEGADDGKSRV